MYKLIKDLITRLRLFLLRSRVSHTLVSIIIPVYNAEKHLHKTLPKILSQSHSNLEIILVDDGSTDNSYQILSEFQQKDSRITLIQQRNQGPGAARNTGLKNATGKYVLFHDADDYMYSSAISRLLTFIVKTRSQVVAGISYVQIKKLISRHSPFQKWDINICFRTDENKAKEYSSSVSVCNKLFSRKFLLKNKLFFLEGIYFEDTEFWARTMYHIRKFSQSPYLITLYRYNPESFSRSIHLENMMKSLFQISEELNQFQQQNQSGSFHQNMNYAILTKPFRFILRHIVISSQSDEYLNVAKQWLDYIPQEHLIAFFYENNKRLALTYLSVKWGYFEAAKQMYEYSYRKKIIKQLKRLPYQNTDIFHTQFCNSFLQHI